MTKTVNHDKIKYSSILKIKNLITQNLSREIALQNKLKSLFDKPNVSAELSDRDNVDFIFALYILYSSWDKFANVPKKDFSYLFSKDLLPWLQEAESLHKPDKQKAYLTENALDIIYDAQGNKSMKKLLKVFQTIYSWNPDLCLQLSPIVIFLLLDSSQIFLEMAKSNPTNKAIIDYMLHLLKGGMKNAYIYSLLSKNIMRTYNPSYEKSNNIRDEIKKLYNSTNAGSSLLDAFMDQNIKRDTHLFSNAHALFHFLQELYGHSELCWSNFNMGLTFLAIEEATGWIHILMPLNTSRAYTNTANLLYPFSARIISEKIEKDPFTFKTDLPNMEFLIYKTLVQQFLNNNNTYPIVNDNDLAEFEMDCNEIIIDSIDKKLLVSKSHDIQAQNLYKEIFSQILIEIQEELDKDPVDEYLFI